MENLNHIYTAVEEKMNKTLENLQEDFSTIRSTRAHPSILENLKVEAYGQMSPVKNVASVSVQDPKTLVVSIWDQGLVSIVDKGIRSANLGLSPRVEGNKLFVFLPPITTERRQEFIKLAKQKAENARVAMRNIRRQYNDELKKLEQEGASKDLIDAAHKKVQYFTDSHIEKIEHSLKEKEKDLYS